VFCHPADQIFAGLIELRAGRQPIMVTWLVITEAGRQAVG
jgi:hypothetical protein